MANSIGGLGAASSAQGYSLESGAGLDADTLLAYCAAKLNIYNKEIKEKMASQQASQKQKSAINKVREELGRYTTPGIGAGDTVAVQKVSTAFVEAIRLMPPGAERDRLIAQFNEFRKTTCYNNHDPGTEGGPPPLDLSTNVACDAYLNGKNTIDGPPTLARELGYDMPAGATFAGARDKSPQNTNDNPANNTNTMVGSEVEAMSKALDDVSSDVGKNAELDMITLQQIISTRQLAIQQTTTLMSKFNESATEVVRNWAK